MAIHESGEMYLESIYVLQKQTGAVRSIDISTHMNYSKPSVSRAVGLLKKGGYITIDENGYISLTTNGEQIAQKIYERHTVLSNMLISLGVDPQTAAQDACRLEHAISDESFAAIKKHVEEQSK